MSEINNFLIDGGVLNSGSAPIVVAQDEIIFDGYSLTSYCAGTGKIQIQTSDFRSVPNIILNTFQNPIINGGGVLSRRYTNRLINFTIYLQGTDNNDLEILIDEFKRRTSKINGLLEIKINSIPRTISATLTKFTINSFKKNDTYIAEIPCTFESVDPFFKSKIGASYTESSVTANIQLSITNNGSIETDAIYTLLFKTGIVALNQVVITISGIVLQIDHAITDGNTLIINGNTKIVTLNGVEIDYIGVFKQLDIGNNAIFFTFSGGSTFNCDITVANEVRYL